MNRSQTQTQTQKIVGIAILAAGSLIISFFSFPLIPTIPFLKMDFGDIPILFGMFAYGPSGGVLVALLRSILHYLFTAGEAGIPIGDFAAFIASCSLTLPTYYSLKRYGQSFKGKMMAVLSAPISLTAVLSFLNYFVLVPLYQQVMNFDVGPMRDYIVGAVIPFNLLKGILVVMVFLLVWRVMEPWMRERFSSR